MMYAVLILGAFLLGALVAVIDHRLRMIRIAKRLQAELRLLARTKQGSV